MYNQFFDNNNNAYPNNPVGCGTLAPGFTVYDATIMMMANQSLEPRASSASAPQASFASAPQAVPVQQECVNQDLSFEDGGQATLLPWNFIPSPFDVIIGRGKVCSHHPGNVRLQAIVQTTLQEYSSAKSRSAKSSIILKVMNFINASSPTGAGFVKKDENSGRWYAAGEFLARERTSQGFRDALSHRYRSSRQSKKIRRKNTIQRRDSQSSTASSTSSNDCSESPVGESKKAAALTAKLSKEDTQSLLNDVMSAFETHFFDVFDDPFEPSPL